MFKRDHQKSNRTEPVAKGSGVKVKVGMKQHGKTCDEVRRKGAEATKVTLPSPEGYMASMHAAPRAKGMAIAMPVKPIAVEYEGKAQRRP